jgi:hypothetical protein
MGVHLFSSLVNTLGRFAENLKVAENGVLERMREKDSFLSRS